MRAVDRVANLTSHLIFYPLHYGLVVDFGINAVDREIIPNLRKNVSSIAKAGDLGPLLYASLSFTPIPISLHAVLSSHWMSPFFSVYPPFWAHISLFVNPSPSILSTYPANFYRILSSFLLKFSFIPTSSTFILFLHQQFFSPCYFCKL